MEWNDNWREKVKAENPIVYERFGDCETKPMDIIIMANAIHEYNKERTTEECLDYIIEWIGNNNCFTTIGKVLGNYNWYLKRVK